MTAYNTLGVSTAHLTDRTISFLASTDFTEWPADGAPVRRIGWFFHSDLDDYTSAQGEIFGDLRDLFCRAAELGYGHVLISNRGEVVDGLPIYRDPDVEETDKSLNMA